MNLRSLLASRAKKAVFSIILVIVVLSASGYAYFSSLSPRSGPSASVISSPLEFTIEMDKTGFTRGEGITIRVSLRNIGNKTISLSWPNFYVQNGTAVCFDFVIIDTNNSQVYRFSQNKVHFNAVEEKTLSPGEQWVNVFVWDQKASYKDVEPVPLGAYSVRASTRQFSLSVDGQTSIINLETPTIALMIN